MPVGARPRLRYSTFSLIVCAGSMTPLVSVIVPFLNAERFLDAAVASVLGQTYPHWDLWLVDDGSTDASTAIARRHAQQHPGHVRYVEHEGHRNRGAAASRNHGISLSSGEYVALLDADDVWLPRKLEEQVTIFTAHPEIGMIYGRSEYWYSWTGLKDDRHRDFAPEPGLPTETAHRPPDMLLRSYPLGTAPTPCPSDMLLRRQAIERTGGFEESFHGIYQLYEDQAFLAKIYLEEAVWVASACWDRYRIHPDSCVSSVNKGGHYHTVRRFYLEWLTRYLERKGVTDPRIWKALRRARRPYDHPLLDRVAKALRLRRAVS